MSTTDQASYPTCLQTGDSVALKRFLRGCHDKLIETLADDGGESEVLPPGIDGLLVLLYSRER